MTVTQLDIMGHPIGSSNSRHSQPQWRGDRMARGNVTPVRPVACADCRSPIEQLSIGRPRLYCSDICRRRMWRRANPEKDYESSRRGGYKWRASNPEKISAKQRAYREANPEMAAAENRRTASARRARQRSAFVEHVDPRRVFERDHGICGICNELVDPIDFHVDHVIPLARGGEHSYANTQTAHPACNMSKGYKLMDTSN